MTTTMHCMRAVASPPTATRTGNWKFSKMKISPDIIQGKKRLEVWQQARDLALTGSFENFDKVVQALKTLGLDAGLDPGRVLACERGTINKLCARSKRIK